MTRRPTSRLLVVVHLSSERTLEPVRQDSSFAEKQESHPALLVVVPSGRLTKVVRDACPSQATQKQSRIVPLDILGG